LDNLTHTLFGLTVARTRLARAGRGTTAALMLASNAPDIDIVTLAGGSLNYLQWHRGPTHGPLGVVGLGVVTATVVWAAQRTHDRRRERERPPTPLLDGQAAAAPAAARLEPKASFQMLCAVSIIGAVLHVLMDLPTAYGTRLLSPFDWHWFSVDVMPIVDIYLLAALAAGLLFGRRSPAARTRNAAIVLTLMAVNYGLRIVAHDRALAMVPRVFGPTLPPPCRGAQPLRHAPLDRWPRSTVPVLTPASGTRCFVEAAAMPSFGSPFQWRLVTQFSNAYELKDVDLLTTRDGDDDDEGGVPWRVTLRYPNVWTPAVEQAAATRTGTVFLMFSRFPAARTSVDSDGVTTVRWADMRYAGGVFAVDQQTRTPNPFTATIRVAPDGRILLETLKPDPPRPR
jgi:membrane-bound metal-dependent hydrolase YbcI (DUF457 family)